MTETRKPEIVNPADLDKAGCQTWLRGRNAFAGHSRSSLATLRQAVATIQAVDAEDPNGTANHDLPEANVAEREVTPDARDRHAAVPDPDTDPAWAAPSGHPTPGAIDRAVVDGLLDGTIKVERPASDDRIERLALAKAEHKALQSWVVGGKVGDRPATPNLDAMNADYAAGTRTSRSPGKAKAPAEVQTPGLRFYRRGTPMTDGQNRLSCVAYQATIGLGPDGRKLSVVELKALLKDRYGIDRPSSTAWEVTFDNGITAGATLPEPRA